MTTYQELRRQVEDLTPDEQLRLLEEIALLVGRRVLSKPKRSIMELEGLGKEIWQGVDVSRLCGSGTSVMEWLIQLQGQTIGLDTAPLIYSSNQES